jgi:hypothetical protein
LGDGNVWTRIGGSAWDVTHRQSGHVRPGCVRTRGLHGLSPCKREGGEEAQLTLGEDRGAVPGVSLRHWAGRVSGWWMAGRLPLKRRSGCP